MPVPSLFPAIKPPTNPGVPALQFRTQIGPHGPLQVPFTLGPSGGKTVASPIADPVAALGAKMKAPAPASQATDVSGMQKLLVSHGYQIPVDGLNGPLTQAAAADFRGSRNPQAFNVGHGLVHAAAPAASAAPAAAAVTPAMTKPAAAPKTRTPAAATATPAVSTASTGAGSDQATATSVINAILAPVIKQITDAENARATQGQSLISGYTKDAVGQLKGIDLGAPAQGAASQENAINTALLAQLKGEGSDLQNQVGGKLAAAGLDAAAPGVTGRIAADTSGAAGAGLAKGDATLSALLSAAAADKAYGEKLPGITSLAGLQDSSKLQGQINTDQATKLGEIQAKVPGMVQSELTTLSSARTAAEKNRLAALIASGYDPLTGGINEKTKIALENAGTAKTRAGIAQQNADTAATRASNSFAVAQAKAAKISPTAAKKLASDIETYYGGVPAKYVPGSNGSQVVPGTGPGTQLYYNDAVSRLTATAVANGATPANAQKLATIIANRYYKPGEGGRPAFTKKQQDANAAIFPNLLAPYGG